ncbi:hypothetical protein, partial [Kaarinaea lacus]
DRPIFQGRDINPYAVKKQASIPVNRRRQWKHWVRKAKVLLWLSPLFLALGYYFSLGEHERIELQLNAAKVMSGKSDGPSSDNDIARDAEQLIKETEARMKDKTDSAKAVKSQTTAKTSVKKPVAKTESRKASTADKSHTFGGRDIPFKDEVKPAARVQAPLPNSTAQTTRLPQDGQPVLPPIPDATTNTSITAAPATTTDTTVSTTSVTTGPADTKVVVPAIPTDTLPEGIVIEKVPDNVDVNAEQNTATFHKSEDGNLETVISQ